jgi:hypothetical protein
LHIFILSRDIALNSKEIELDKYLLAILANRISKDANEITSVRELAQNNIDNNKATLKQPEKSILLLEFKQDYLKNF